MTATRRRFLELAGGSAHGRFLGGNLSVLAGSIGSGCLPDGSGAMIGHLVRQFTLPEGVEMEIDALKGTIGMLEPAVG
jgi:muramoyltetrapeptide carboxypeptidase LdcA involved in peptidoglycan recycling